MICAKCHSELLEIKYNDHNYYFFCGECGDKGSEFEVLFHYYGVAEDADFEFKEPKGEW